MSDRFGLKAASIKTLPLTDDGKTRMHGDGRGLSVLCEPSKDGVTRSYNFRFTAPADGSRQTLRLGHIDELSLNQAREKATAFRTMIREGKDPRHAINTTAAGQVTVKQYADQNWDDLTGGKPTDYFWNFSLGKVAALHDAPIGTVTRKQVYETIKPFWRTNPLTASRVMQKVSKIFNHARVNDVRADNPALLADLKVLGLEQTHKVKSHNALPYADLPAMMHKLAYQPEVTARAVEFTILTGCRSQEAREARWSWLNADMTTITIPAAFMKGRLDHVIPLATQVTEMLRKLPRTSAEWIFASPYAVGREKPLRPHALLDMANRVLCLEGKNHTETVKLHGFRSTFRDYCADKTEFAREVIEFCLAHREGSAAEKAYWRSDMIEKRRAVMQTWADYATGQAAPANVVRLKKEVA